MVPCANGTLCYGPYANGTYANGNFSSASTKIRSSIHRVADAHHGSTWTTQRCETQNRKQKKSGRINKVDHNAGIGIKSGDPGIPSLTLPFCEANFFEKGAKIPNNIQLITLRMRGP